MEKKEDYLWHIASARVGARKSLYSYITLNIVFWVIWFFQHRNESSLFTSEKTPWPLYVTVIWGIFLVVQFLRAYFPASRQTIEHEYDKLKSKKK